MNSVVAINRRARSEEQKALRRQAVLEAAEGYFAVVGYEAFSMAHLAKRAGLVKGTLYLYFKTKEELFLTLYEKSLIRWSEVFISNLSEPMPSGVYARTLHNTAMADATFVPLLIRLEHVIEHNVSIPRLIESKRAFIQEVELIAESTSKALKLSLGEAREVVKTLGVLLIGATRTDQGPFLDDEELPQDVQELIAGFSSEALFIKNAVRIIEGIRADAIAEPKQNQ